MPGSGSSLVEEKGGLLADTGYAKAVLRLRDAWFGDMIAKLQSLSGGLSRGERSYEGGSMLAIRF